MKQFILISLLLLVLGCKSDAEKKPAEEPIKLTEVAPNDAQLVATWELIKTTVNGEDQTVQANTLITFYNNNTYKGFNNTVFRYEIKKDTLLLYNSEAAQPEKTQLYYLNESKDIIQLTTKLADGSVVQTQLRRKVTN